MSGFVTEILAIATVLMLLVLIGMVFALLSKLANLAELVETVAGHKTAEAETGKDKVLVQGIEKAIDERISSFDIVFSGMQAKLVTIADDLHEFQSVIGGAASWPPRTPPIAPTQAMQVPPAPVSKMAEPASDAPLFAGPPVQESRSGADGRICSSVLDEYRQLIAEPRKAEINRWADEHGGISCAIKEDGTIAALSREAGGMLLVVCDRDGSRLLLPGGRMVVEFATSFANMMSMRSVTRDCFELTSDGSGILRLLEPALVTGDGGHWDLASPGQLSGFTS